MTRQNGQEVPSVENDYECQATAEQRLMQSVIITAIADAKGNGAICDLAERERARVDAINWFERGGEDFREVCSLAGLDPHSMRRAAIEFIASGQKLPPLQRPGRSTGQRRSPRGQSKAALIAETAGLSVSSVRNVLTGSMPVSPQVRRQVEAAIAEVENRSIAA